jgi:hypothetical protein
VGLAIAGVAPATSATAAPATVRADSPTSEVVRALAGGAVETFALREIYAVDTNALGADSDFVKDIRVAPASTEGVERWIVRRRRQFWLVVLVQPTLSVSSAATSCCVAAAFTGRSADELQLRSSHRFCSGGRSWKWVSEVGVALRSGRPVLRVTSNWACGDDGSPCEDQSWYEVRGKRFIQLKRQPRWRSLPQELSR